MMLRHLFLLIVSLVVLVGSAFAAMGLDRLGVRQQASLRSVRVQVQQLRQQLTILQSPETMDRLTRLTESVESVQIRLVEGLTQKPWPMHVDQVRYELAIMPEVITPTPEGDITRVLRLDMTVAAQNSIAYLAMLERVDAAIGQWPHETRACAFQRQLHTSLQIRCILDIYHWQAAPDPERGVKVHGSDRS